MNYRNEIHFDDVKTNVQAQANESEFKFHYTDDEPVMDPGKLNQIRDLYRFYGIA